MRLICSKNNEIFIEKHWEWICGLMRKNPENVIRKYPQIAVQLHNGCELSCSENISQENWQKFLMDFFLTKLVGRHKELIKIFMPFPDFSPGQYFIGSYRLQSVLGTGTDSCVYKTTDGYCLKVVSNRKKNKLKKEYDILQNMHHKNIVRCFDFICSADYAAILLEELIPVFGSEEAYVQGLEYCHSQGILHGDIRLRNLGTDANGNGKLFDFGNAERLGSQQEAQREIVMLKNIMQSPVVLAQRSVAAYGKRAC